jgi:hypothetical protein
MKKAFISSVLGFTASLFFTLTGHADEVHVIGTYRGKKSTNEDYQLLEKRRDKACPSFEYCGKLPMAACKIPIENCNRAQEILDQSFPGRIDVDVTRTGTPLTLILTAHDRTKWRIKAAKGVTIKRIILSGYEPQTLRKSKLLKNIRVEKASYEEGDSHAFYFNGDDREVPVGFLQYSAADQSLKCSSQVDLFPINSKIGKEDNFRNTLRELKKRGLTPTSIQSQKSEARRFSITNETKSVEISKLRPGGYCYQNPNGTVSEGTD